MADSSEDPGTQCKILPKSGKILSCDTHLKFVFDCLYCWLSSPISYFPFPLSLCNTDVFFGYVSSAELSSELQVDINTQDLYLSFDKKSFKPVSLNRSFSELAFNDKEVKSVFIVST